MLFGFYIAKILNIYRIYKFSAEYFSVSHKARSAIKEFSDVNAKRSLEMVDELTGYYKEYRDYLSHISGNLNQTVKRANELSVAGLLTPAYLSQVVLPSIDSAKKSIGVLQAELLKVTQKIYKKYIKHNW